MILWLKVTADNLELPVAVADTARQLADMVGTTTNNIHSSISKSKSRGYRSQYIKVEIEEDDLNEIN